MFLRLSLICVVLFSIQYAVAIPIRTLMGGNPPPKMACPLFSGMSAGTSLKIPAPDASSTNGWTLNSDGKSNIMEDATTLPVGGSSETDGKNNISAGDAGFGLPDGDLGQGISQANVQAKYDGDGSGEKMSGDSTYQSTTSGTVNGKFVDGNTYNYIAYSPDLKAQGVQIGDWAQIQGPGGTSYARVMDLGPRGNTGEMSYASLRSVGIQIDSTGSGTIGNPHVNVTYYPGSKSIKGS